MVLESKKFSWDVLDSCESVSSHLTVSALRSTVAQLNPALLATDFKIAPACMGTFVSVNGQLRTRISGLSDCICPLTISAMNYL
jgi:hypothetical protein